MPFCPPSTFAPMQLPFTLIDDAFYVKQSRWGTWSSYDKEGKKLVTSLNEKLCTDSTRFYLKGLQEGFLDSGPCYDGSVQGKL
jgi:hypothetical protein